MSANGQIDLFTPPLLPGLRYGPGLVSAGEEVRLIESINRKIGLLDSSGFINFFSYFSLV